MWLNISSIRIACYWCSRCLDSRTCIIQSCPRMKGRMTSESHPSRPFFVILCPHKETMPVLMCKTSFFRYCYLHCSPNANKTPLDPTAISKSPSISSRRQNTIQVIKGEEVEIISDVSWRNFFTSINFLKIMQKMTKHRSHRTCMLNTYKSSVSPTS